VFADEDHLAVMVTWSVYQRIIAAYHLGYGLGSLPGWWDALRGRLIYVPRARLPAAEEDEFYVEDLAGMDVYAGGDSPAGRVRSVQNFGSGDLLEVDVTGLASSVFVPFTQADQAPVV
jgi:hypothetical protein